MSSSIPTTHPTYWKPTSQLFRRPALRGGRRAPPPPAITTPPAYTPEAPFDDEAPPSYDYVLYEGALPAYVDDLWKPTKLQYCLETLMKMLITFIINMFYLLVFILNTIWNLPSTVAAVVYMVVGIVLSVLCLVTGAFGSSMPPSATRSERAGQGNGRRLRRRSPLPKTRRTGAAA